MIKFVLSLCIVCTFVLCAVANNNNDDLPVLVIGASYSSGKSPADSNGAGTLDGLSVADGSYMDMGMALTRELNKGYVINEGVGGATTYARADWISYDQQLNIACKRVVKRPTTELNARYVVITAPNDCLHAAAPDPATGGPCNAAALTAVVDRLQNTVDTAKARGLTPVVVDYPPFANAQGKNGIDMQLFGTVFGMPWVISKQDYESLRSQVRARFNNKPGVEFVDAWGPQFKHLGDGIHPDYQTMKRAGRRVADAMGC